MADDEFLSRRTVRHALLRARNARVATLRDDRMPLLLQMHPDTLTELLIDSDPLERHTIDFEGKAFMGVPISTHPAMTVGDVAIRWPETPAPAAGGFGRG